MKIRILNHYYNLPIALLAMVEMLLILCSPIAVETLFFGRSFENLVSVLPSLAPKALAFTASCGLALIAMGLYSARLRARTLGILLRVVVAHALALVLLASLSFFVHELQPTPGRALLWAAVSLFLVMAARIVEGALVDDDTFKRRVLVYGTGNRAQNLMQLRRRADQRGFFVVGYLQPPGEASLVDPKYVLSSPVDQLRAIAKEHGVDEIVIAMDDRRREFPVRELLDCRLNGVEVIDLVSFLERETGRVHVDVLNPSWIIFGEGFRRDAVRQSTKRGFDVAASLVLAIITLPVVLLTMLAIVLEEGPRAPIFYRQRRVGLDGNEFDVLKFRSMRTDAEGDGKARWASGTDSRVTRVGKFIRKVRIDELPQIFNVLRGDMSFVGPRPERPPFVSQLADSIPYYSERHCTKPGITGWAQVCYPYGSSEKDALEKLQYDLYYVKNHTLLFDLMILLQTVEVVLLGKGGR
jgi:sugar transferase (PEP-CTERM system associated)